MGSITIPQPYETGLAVHHIEPLNPHKNNGRLDVFRVTVASDAGLNTVVYKPTTDQSTYHSEVWRQREFLTYLPVTTPKLLASLEDAANDLYWLVYEDAGTLTHTTESKFRVRAAEEIVKWHAVSQAGLTHPADSFLPSITEVHSHITENLDTYHAALRYLGLSDEFVENFFHKVVSLAPKLSMEQVVSHGDYHLMNLSPKDNDLIVLDWEFLQVNSVYWDLYTLLDMVSPRYAISPCATMRTSALEAYRDKRSEQGWQMDETFFRDYHVFCSIYSIWISKLLMTDLEAGSPFSYSSLERERSELVQIFLDCSSYLSSCEL